MSISALIPNGGGGRIRTSEGGASRFTVCPLWPLGNPSVQYIKMATWKGLEPSTSSVTGWHSNHLNYRATFGGRNRARTYDPLLVRQVLSQLSYATI